VYSFGLLPALIGGTKKYCAYNNAGYCCQVFRQSFSKKTYQDRKSPIGRLKTSCIFDSVFHRILDFKNGAEFLFWPHFFCTSPKPLQGGTSGYERTTFPQSNCVIHFILPFLFAYSHSLITIALLFLVGRPVLLFRCLLLYRRCHRMFLIFYLSPLSHFQPQ
jgi:hypothetical protein